MIRTVDQSKCIGCGACQKICPLDVFRMDINQPEASPCMNACPIGVDIRRVNYLLAEGHIENASRVLHQHNPLAPITGRVCPNFCELDCTRNSVDEALNFGAIEAFLGDYRLHKPVEPVPCQHLAPVAVVGAGPAGLSCAWFLAERGFEVTVFESRAEPGGMLRFGIPEFRLPSAVLADCIESLETMGVTFRCNRKLGRDFDLGALWDLGFGSAFLGLGAGKPKNVPFLDTEGDNVFFGVDFLEKARSHSPPEVGSRAVVIGGGDVAMDAAQTALMLGAGSVTVVTLEGEDDLPAYSRNVATARYEGVRFMHHTGIKAVHVNGDKALSVDLMPCLSVFNQNGEFSPVFDPTKTRRLDLDTLILAVGQEANLGPLPKELLTGDGFIAANAETCQTAVPGLFAAGDAVTGPMSVAGAIGGGKRAAMAIEWFQLGRDLGGMPLPKKPVIAVSEAYTQTKKTTRLQRTSVVNPQKHANTRSFQGFDLLQTLTEADRCMSCGGKATIAHRDDCMTCFSCELNCPTQAIFVHPFKEILPRSLRPI